MVLIFFALWQWDHLAPLFHEASGARVSAEAAGLLPDGVTKKEGWLELAKKGMRAVLAPEKGSGTPGEPFPAELPTPAAQAELSVADQASLELTRDQKIEKFLRESKVEGISVGAGHSRILMNGRSYQVGDRVEAGLGLRIRKGEEDRVWVVDEEGKDYELRF
jgi:hypothetical protein